MKKWVCSVCGYVYEGEQPPVECPVCHVDGSKFKEMEEGKLAAEHGHAGKSYCFCKAFHECRFSDSRRAPDKDRTARCYV